MGWLDDILDTCEKIIRSPLRFICAMDAHEWVQRVKEGWVVRRCKVCGHEEKVRKEATND